MDGPSLTNRRTEATQIPTDTTRSFFEYEADTASIQGLLAMRGRLPRCYDSIIAGTTLSGTGKNIANVRLSSTRLGFRPRPSRLQAITAQLARLVGECRT